MDTFIASLVTAEYNQFGKFVKTLQMFRGICNPMRIFNMEKNASKKPLQYAKSYLLLLLINTV